MGARILIIEDNATNLELITFLLRAFGHSPTSAMDGLSGLQCAREQLPDLVICDIQLPELDGFGVAARFKSDARLSLIPLVAVTALAMVGDREKILAAGFDGYLAKPIEPQLFVGQVESFLVPEAKAAAQEL